MSWRWKDPRTFPAYYADVLRSAAAAPETPVLLSSTTTRSDLDDIAEHFRWFRWCIRQKPDFDRALSTLEDSFDFRLSKSHTPEGVILYIRARKTKLSDLLTLNQSLIQSLEIRCQ